MNLTEKEFQVIKKSLEDLKVYRLQDNKTNEMAVGGLYEDEEKIFERLNVTKNGKKIIDIIESNLEKRLDNIEICMVKIIARNFLEFDQYVLNENPNASSRFKNVGKRNPDNYKNIEQYFEELSGAMYYLSENKESYEKVKDGLKLSFYDLCNAEFNDLLKEKSIELKDLFQFYKASDGENYGKWLKELKMNIWENYFGQVYKNLLNYTIKEYKNKGIKEFKITNATLEEFKQMLKNN